MPAGPGKGSVSAAEAQGGGGVGGTAHPRPAQQTRRDAGNSVLATEPNYPPLSVCRCHMWAKHWALVIQQEPRGPTGDGNLTLKGSCVLPGLVAGTREEEVCGSPQDHLPLRDLECTRVVLRIPDSPRSPGVGTTDVTGVSGVTQAYLAIILW